MVPTGENTMGRNTEKLYELYEAAQFEREAAGELQTFQPTEHDWNDLFEDEDFQENVSLAVDAGDY